MKIKKITALLLTVALGATMLIGCSKNYTSVMTIDGEEIAPNIYLLSQLESYMNASKKAEAGTDVLKSTIEEKPAQQWIHDETIKTLQSYVFTNKEFDSRKLSMTEDELLQIDATAQSMWSIMEPMYKPNGVGFETYKDMLLSTYKGDKIFDAIYGEGGEKAPTNDEVKKYLQENYIRLKGFKLSKMDAEGKAVSEGAVKELSDAANEAVKELNEGAAFEETLVKYMTMGGAIVKSETDYSSAAGHIWEEFIKKDSEKYPIEFVNKGFAASVDGKYTVYEAEDGFIVYTKVDNFTNEGEIDSLKKSLVAEMKNAEFSEFIQKGAAALEIKADDGAVKYYSVSKIKY
ncbi:MAG: hypothetical protein RR846_00950 [Oscillospiraceae bacterium]